MQRLRKAAVKGLFYPADCRKLEIYIQKFGKLVTSEARADPIFKSTPKAVIVPHAGYVYSGFTANMAYMSLSNSSAKRVIVIGPSHHHYFEGISAGYYETYETPCGTIPIDTDYLISLAKKFKIGFEEKAHQKEHSTEVQMPFIRHYLPRAEVIELIYGRISSERIAEIIDYLLKDKDNLVVISSDLSHYYTRKRARELDEHCLRAISKLDVDELHRGCEACGLTGIEGMIKAAKTLGLRSRLIDYRTSADYSGDTSRVVGYASAVFY